VAYRDDLEAALEHAQSVEEELARARAELQVDEKRIAAGVLGLVIYGVLRSWRGAMPP
jgi:hypothetical protein